jgi:hypothetical protein
MTEPFNVEVSTGNGASKWVRNVKSHTIDELEAALKESEIITVVDVDGSKTVIDFGEVFMIRAQDDNVFRRRTREVKKRNGGR